MGRGKAGGLNPEREARKARFLSEHGLAAARREPLAGDASTRSYVRLHPAGGAPLILMDQPPVLETPICPPAASDAERRALGYNAAARLAAGSIAAFVTTAAWLARPWPARRSPGSWPSTWRRAWRFWRTWATASSPP